jgi:hypothetical protein
MEKCNGPDVALVRSSFPNRNMYCVPLNPGPFSPDEMVEFTNEKLGGIFDTIPILPSMSAGGAVLNGAGFVDLCRQVIKTAQSGVVGDFPAVFLSVRDAFVASILRDAQKMYDDLRVTNRNHSVTSTRIEAEVKQKVARSSREMAAAVMASLPSLVTDRNAYWSQVINSSTIDVKHHAHEVESAGHGRTWAKCCVTTNTTTVLRDGTINQVTNACGRDCVSGFTIGRGQHHSPCGNW